MLSLLGIELARDKLFVATIQLSPDTKSTGAVRLLITLKKLLLFITHPSPLIVAIGNADKALVGIAAPFPVII
jgi:hypothetical protein